MALNPFVDKATLHPRQVVLDLVLSYSAKMPALGHAFLSPHRPGPDTRNLVLFATNHRGKKLNLTVPVHFDGDAVDGANPRFVLYQLGATVWKLAPSILFDELHAYITIVGVPEGAWSL